MSLKDIQGAYYALGILIAIAACVLMVEHGLRGSRFVSWLDDQKASILKGYASGYIGTPGYATEIQRARQPPEGTKTVIANGKGVSNGYVSNGIGVVTEIANGYTTEVANGYIARDFMYSNGYPANGDAHNYQNGHVGNNKKKKEKGYDANDMASRAPVFSRSLFS